MTTSALSFFGWWRQFGQSAFEKIFGFAIDSIYQAENRPLDPTTIQSPILTPLAFYVSSYETLLQSNNSPANKFYVRLEARLGIVYFRQGKSTDNGAALFSATTIGSNAMLSVPTNSHEDFELTTEYPGFWVASDVAGANLTQFVSCVSSPDSDQLQTAGAP